MSYLAKVSYLSLNTKRLDKLGYQSIFEGEVYLSPSGAVVVDPDVGACFIPNQCIEMAVLEDGWREEIDPPEPKPIPVSKYTVGELETKAEELLGKPATKKTTKKRAAK